MHARCLKFFALLSLPLFLAACGDGYEMVRTDAFPYGNQRTAGTGVAYVVANMMPERTLNLETATPMQEPMAAPVVEEKPVQETKEILQNIEDDMEELFEEEQKK